ncbi:PPA1309 family protein [Nakamurella panacisegetis]|uniref:PPA1309 family protein n=1 Tax=Nakamurella panacisegetis TaxID=1090615 RepID=UPI001E452500|nr:PPA1309 family protein [Nakamurella panacisegetis]
MASNNIPAGSDPVDPASLIPPAQAPYWWEDPDLAAAVAEVEEFVGSAGWDAAPQMFALVRTADLAAAQPGLAAALADSGVFTPIAQEVLPPGDLSEALSTISWPDEVAGCVLVQEIVVLPPSAVATRAEGSPERAQDLLPGEADAEGSPTSAANTATTRAEGSFRESNDVEITAEEAAAHPDRVEARLAAGVLRDGKGGACLLRVRGKDDATPLRGGDLAPNLLRALHATFED